ncbi:MAG: acetyl-CoA C-acyltransferase [Kouleothrix sp.]|jgi:acetyl-CoA C-acetyltransferase|nr:acetyl-CoA C-acyltransferase [Kouleothrix sp.]
MLQAHDIVIVGAARTPIGKFQGAYKDMPATELGAAAIRAAVARAGLDAALVDECIMGNVVGAGLGQAPARQAALAGGLPASVGALTINKVCGSGLKAVMLASALIRSGEARVIVAGGMENMTRAPYLLPQARAGYRLGNGELIDAVVQDGLWCPFEHQHMGNSAEWIARNFDISRAAQDAFAAQSHARALAAHDAGAFADEIVPIELPAARGKPTTLSVDEPPRRDTDAKALAGLRPAFAPDGTVTAGNAPGITDGAAALVVTSAAVADEQGLTPIARVLGAAQAAVTPLELFTAPVFAVRTLMERTGTTMDSYDLFEINEAFAAQVVQNGRALGIDWDRLNVHGGAIALGHPIGASGARVLVTLIHALKRRGGQRGLASLCLGGGEAVALAIELV